MAEPELCECGEVHPGGWCPILAGDGSLFPSDIQPHPQHYDADLKLHGTPPEEA